MGASSRTALTPPTSDVTDITDITNITAICHRRHRRPQPRSAPRPVAPTAARRSGAASFPRSWLRKAGAEGAERRFLTRAINGGGEVENARDKTDGKTGTAGSRFQADVTVSCPGPSGVSRLEARPIRHGRDGLQLHGSCMGSLSAATCRAGMSIRAAPAARTHRAGLSSPSPPSGRAQGSHTQEAPTNMGHLSERICFHG